MSEKSVNNDINATTEENIKYKKKRALFLNVKEIVISVLFCLMFAYTLNTFIIINANIPTASMENTLPTNSRLFGCRLSYIFSSPKRGDIIIFKAPDKENTLYVKRVIGTPNDKVYIDNGKLYINDEEIEEDYIKEEMYGTFGPYEVPEDSYFVLGDNRNHSGDSRYWHTTNYVKKKDIVAKAKLLYYPNWEIFP